MPASSQENAQPTAEPRSSGKPLFSQHWLLNRLPNESEWAEDPRPVFDKVRVLYEQARQQGAHWNESQTEQFLLKPMLDLLGWVYTPQPAAIKDRRLSRPDYALFADVQKRDEANPLQGDDAAFYSRALAIAEAKRWGRALSQRDPSGRDTWKAESNPSHQMVSYLYATRSVWGILTNGTIWRLYNRDVSSVASEFYEIDLGLCFDLLGASDEPTTEHLAHFKRWWLFFRRDAFVAITRGKPFVQRVYDGSTTYAREVSENLKKLVFEEVMPGLAGGFVAYRSRQLSIGAETDKSLRQIYQASLSLLYKLLFVLYAEARALLPVNEESYRDQSLTDLAKWAQDRHDRNVAISDGTANTPKYAALLALFNRIDCGDRELKLPRYNGGLFSPANPDNQFLQQHRLSDRCVAGVVDTLVRDAGQPVDYAYISVRNLGAIYEGLLENRLNVSDAASGKVELVNDKGERKASGSYYTPDYIVDYIVQHTLDPILSERQTRFEQAMDRIAALRRTLHSSAADDHTSNERLRAELGEAERDALDAFLGIKVCDPAMGSGHFLVNAVDHLTDGVIERMQAYHNSHEKVPWDWNPIQRLIERMRGDIHSEMAQQGITIESGRVDDTALLTRLVMKRCIYGVDLNPLAVELAKLSLWLHSFTVGAPLSFLDHHLRWGNSLIGADVRTVQQAMQATTLSTKVSDLTRARAKARGEQARLVVTAPQGNLFAGPFAGLLDLTAVMTDVAGRSDATLADVHQSAEDFASFQNALTPYKQILDIWISQYFGNAAAVEFLRTYSENLVAVLEGAAAVKQVDQAIIEQARLLWQDKRFFHWDLEFPEVFVDLRKRDWAANPGFDAVIGNPPYLLLQPENTDEAALAYYRSLDVAQYKVDTYHLFIQVAVRLACEGGIAGYITPSAFLTNNHTTKLRGLILSRTQVLRLLVVPDGVFEEASVDNVVFVLRREDEEASRNAHVVVCEIAGAVGGGLELRRSASITQSEFLRTSGHIFSVGHNDLVTKIAQVSCLPLGEIANVNFGMQLRDRHQFPDDVVRASKGRNLSPDYRPCVTGQDVNRYDIAYGELYAYYNTVAQRGGCWQTSVHFAAEKLVVRQIGKTPMAGYDDAKYCCLNTVFMVTLRDLQYSIKYVLTVLNSRCLGAYWRAVFYDQKDTFPKIKGTYLADLPIRRISFTTAAEERARLGEEGQALYETLCADHRGLGHLGGLAEPLLGFVRQRLAHTPEQSDVVHDLLAHLAGQMIELNKQKQAEVKGFLAWLESVSGALVDDLPGKTTLQNYVGDYQKGEAPRTQDEALAVLRKNARKLGKGVDPSGRDFTERFAAEYAKSLAKLLPIKQRLAATDRLIDQIVYLLYGLTDEEIALVEGR